MIIDRVAFENLSDDGLTGVRWTFVRLDNQLVVDSYEEVQRETRRHRFKVIRYWSRLDSRRRHRDATIGQDAVPLTPELAQQAKTICIQQLQTTLSVGFQR
jgi:hypothetical protein